jgi:hypothetical protein
MQAILSFLSLYIIYLLVTYEIPNCELEVPIKGVYSINEYSEGLDSLYQLDTIISLQGSIKRDKSGTHINGIYLKEAPDTKGILKIKGKLKRVAYPLSYYSTNESPQGMFSDTSMKHYRLFLEPSSVEII